MEQPIHTTVTLLLGAVRNGDRAALNALFPIIYEELRIQAQRQRGRWHGDYTVNTKALVHEAYLKLVDQSHIRWDSRAHFLAVAAKAMRHILIDYAKRRRRMKRGGDQPNVPLDDIEERIAEPKLWTLSEERAEVLVGLDTALEQLKQLNDRQYHIVECRFFGGMTIPDTAEALDISPATVKRDWRLAQAWLYLEMNH